MGGGNALPYSKHRYATGTTTSVLEESNQTEAAGNVRSCFGLTEYRTSISGKTGEVGCGGL